MTEYTHMSSYTSLTEDYCLLKILRMKRLSVTSVTDARHNFNNKSVLQSPRSPKMSFNPNFDMVDGKEFGDKTSTVPKLLKGMDCDTWYQKFFLWSMRLCGEAHAKSIRNQEFLLP